MPLIQSGSEEARQKNIETEIAHGKDPKQAVAIGYSVQRANDEEMPPSLVLQTLAKQNKWSNP